MKKMSTKLGAALTTAAVIASTLVPVAMADTVTIERNGADSDNNVTLNNSNTTTISQSNETVIVNSVQASSNTGNNDANQNSGGDVRINTGNAETKVKIENSGSSNHADVAKCACPEHDTPVIVERNGADSDNTVIVNNMNNLTVNQMNVNTFINSALARSNTGWNDANKNTDGDARIKTGKAKSKVKIINTGTSNALN